MFYLQEEDGTTSEKLNEATLTKHVILFSGCTPIRGGGCFCPSESGRDPSDPGDPGQGGGVCFLSGASLRNLHLADVSSHSQPQ